jgi:hypothetical protein
MHAGSGCICMAYHMTHAWCWSLSCRFKQWYPVAVLSDLDQRLPMHAQLLGMDLAIWWDSSSSQWRCGANSSVAFDTVGQLGPSHVD